jgi:uridine kinase
MFLHRPELREYWDFSIFVDVDFEISIPRGAARGVGYGSPNPDALSNRRYIEGQKLYFMECRPHEYASIVVDNNDLSSPKITRVKGDGSGSVS